MTFLTGYLKGICRWFLMFGHEAEIESPSKVRELMGELVDELSAHYKVLQ